MLKGKGILLDPPIFQDFQIPPSDRFENVGDDIRLALLEEGLSLKSWVDLHNLGESGRKLRAFENSSKDILHL